MSLLEVKNLCIGYQTSKGLLKAVDNVNFTVESGKSLGLVGESGCGKTTIGLALMGLLPENGQAQGSILLKGQDLLAMDEDQLRAMRWSEVAMIFQAAMNALNPVQRVSSQMVEAILVHRRKTSPQAARQKIVELFELVGLDPARLDDYPHQYSGGMKQRAIIAMALSLEPGLIIADEPTTALDVIVQDQILREIQSLQNNFGIGMIFISHDISIVAEVCHQIGVMYAGQLVEIGSAEEVFENAQHPYTKALLASYPTLDGPRKGLKPIPGEPPNLVGRIPGCRFCDRCPRPDQLCKLEPPAWLQISPSHNVLCDHCLVTS